ncbi:MAG: hypothetical protein QNJ44_00350 [Rhodobacter sp.]|nr:hypothetical protein [Rhodobacter sp.]
MTATIAQNPERAQFINYVDRFLTAVDAIPRSAAGDAAVPQAIKQFRLSMQALAGDADKRTADLPHKDVIKSYFAHLDHAMSEFDCAVSEAVGVACLGDDPAPVFYDTVARSALDIDALVDIAKSDRPATAIELVMLQAGAPLVFTAPRLTEVQCEIVTQLIGLKFLLVAGAKLFLEIGKALDGLLGLFLRALAQAGLDALEMIDKGENFDVTPKKKPGPSSAGKTCFVSVLLPKLDLGGAVIDTLELQFIVNGTTFTVSGAPSTVAGPMAMGPCGTGNKDVSVSFTAVNKDFPSKDEIGTTDSQVDKSPCPNRAGQGQLVMKSTVQDDKGVLKTITATVTVIKFCA